VSIGETTPKGARNAPKPFHYRLHKLDSVEESTAAAHAAKRGTVSSIQITMQGATDRDSSPGRSASASTHVLQPDRTMLVAILAATLGAAAMFTWGALTLSTQATNGSWSGTAQTSALALGRE
jgi:hypothetical protein